MKMNLYIKLVGLGLATAFTACTDYQADYADAWEGHPDYQGAFNVDQPSNPSGDAPIISDPGTIPQETRDYCVDLNGFRYQKGETENTYRCTCADNGVWDCPATNVTCKDVDGDKYNVGEVEPYYSCICQPDGSWDCMDFVDDFEDGDGICRTGGSWFAYSDATEGGASSFSNPKDLLGNYSVTFSGSPAKHASAYVGGLTDVRLSKGMYLYDPYIDIGVDFRSNSLGYDLSSCVAVKYEYRGAAHRFNVVMADDYDGLMTKYNFHGYKVAASDKWKTVTIPWDALAQESGWGRKSALDKSGIGRFAWEMKGSVSLPYLFLDNIRCVGMYFPKK